MSATIRVIASARNWIESKAVDQLKSTGSLAGMVAAVGMPDLHPGKGSPIGAAFACKDFIYPFLIGNDIGCGMTLWQTDISKGKIRLDKWLRRLESLENAPVEEAVAYLHAVNVDSSGFEHSIGTVGGGNHFAELQRVQQVDDEGTFSSLGLDADKLMLLVHSGSRGLGESILRAHTERFGAEGLPAEGEEAATYLRKHDHALRWASANRAFIGSRFLTALSCQAGPILDLHHNFVERGTINGDTSVWLHRKGACPSDRGVVVIPGSRGALTYLLKPTDDQEKNLYTLAHGAGRKWTRADCRGRLEKKYSPESFLKTELGGRVICTDKNLLYEEAPQAYKDIDVVVQDLIDEGLVTTIATLAPVISYKTADNSAN
jgi:release factor H-coupled RctB family protein